MAGLACRSAVVKLGGSLVTVKSRARLVDWAGLSSAASQLASYVSMGGRLAVVHGGGGFGHASVAELGGRGALDARAAALVQLDMLRLAVAVADVLSSHGVPAVVHTTHTLCTCGGRCSLEAPARDYRLGLVPVLYGDALPCPHGGAEILSGDRLAVLLAGELGVDCLVYAGREPGVRGPDGSVVEELDVRGGLPPWLGGAGGFDQTGGMAGKVAEAARAPRSVRVMIVGGPSILEALRTGRAGTVVVR